MKLFCETCSVFKLDNIKNAAILLDIPNFELEIGNNSARLPHFFDSDNIENEEILRDSCEQWKVESRADGLIPLRFAIFALHLSKVLHLPRKSEARSYEVLHLSRKII